MVGSNIKAIGWNPRRGVSRCGGFSVVEAVIAMGVVGVLIISLYGALTSGFNGVQLGRENMRATQILVKKMDQFRLFTWEQVTNSGWIPTSFLEPFNAEVATPPTNSGPLVYSGTVTISSFPDTQ